MTKKPTYEELERKVRELQDTAVKCERMKKVLQERGDPTQMQMVLSALLSNASDAIEDEGCIRVSTKEEVVSEVHAKGQTGLKAGRYVCLIVEDDGKGMDTQTSKRVLEPFFTTKFQGRGLGMAAVYGIVKNHEGWISLDSELDKGTVVRIYLPAIEAKKREEKAPEIEPAKRTATILVVEDEEMVMDVSRRVLERLGHRVLEAKRGKEAVEIARTFDGDIDLAILDIKLPDMEGQRVYPLLMEARPNLKVLVCSGYSIEGPAQAIMDAGAQGFIQKPFSIATVSEKLKEVLG
jgi:CheY-like chemotaxis protein